RQRRRRPTGDARDRLRGERFGSAVARVFMLRAHETRRETFARGETYARRVTRVRTRVGASRRRTRRIAPNVIRPSNRWSVDVADAHVAWRGCRNDEETVSDAHERPLPSLDRGHGVLSARGVRALARRGVRYCLLGTALFGCARRAAADEVCAAPAR